ncbi:MAG: tetratricopeptide repeat protein [Phycisphaerales bacterium]|nr:tetratricopeptide repeat protein [Phycisphaerales bacterium]
MIQKYTITCVLCFTVGITISFVAQAIARTDRTNPLPHLVDNQSDTVATTASNNMNWLSRTLTPPAPKTVAECIISAQWLLAQNDYYGALNTINKGIKLNKNNAPAYNLKGQIEITLGQYSSAINDFKKALKNNPQYKEAELNLAFALSAKDQKIKTKIPKISKSRNNAPNELITDADLLWKSQKYNDALNTINLFMKHHSKSADAHILRGKIFVSLQSYQLALEDFTTAINLSPNNAEAYSRRGEVYLYLKKYRKAIKDLGLAIRLDPSNAEAKQNYLIATNELNKTKGISSQQNSNNYSNQAPPFNQQQPIYRNPIRHGLLRQPPPSMQKPSDWGNGSNNTPQTDNTANNNHTVLLESALLGFSWINDLSYAAYRTPSNSDPRYIVRYAPGVSLQVGYSRRYFDIAVKGSFLYSPNLYYTNANSATNTVDTINFRSALVYGATVPFRLFFSKQGVMYVHVEPGYNFISYPDKLDINPSLWVGLGFGSHNINKKSSILVSILVNVFKQPYTTAFPVSLNLDISGFLYKRGQPMNVVN